MCPESPISTRPSAVQTGRRENSAWTRKPDSGHRRSSPPEGLEQQSSANVELLVRDPEQDVPPGCKQIRWAAGQRVGHAGPCSEYRPGGARAGHGVRLLTHRAL